MSSDAPQVPVAGQKNRRPQSVLSLLYQGEAHANWNYANKRLARFFVTNLQPVIARLNVQVTKTDAYFRRAEEAIAKATAWNTEQPFDYTCSKTHIYADNIGSPKAFGRGATLIVAMEFAAAENSPTLNVYDHLRLLPAQYFVDQFDRRRLNEIEEFHKAMTAEDKQAKFGSLAQRSFEDICLANIRQSKSGFLSDVVNGYCITRYTAEKLTTFINSNYPEQLHIGPILSAGQDSVSSGLGTQAAVEGMRVPPFFEPELLPPCS